MRRVVGMVCGLALVVAGVASTVAEAATLPAGFTDELVASAPSPTALAFTPDGRMLITTQSGTVRVVKGGALLATPALDITTRICTNSERGLLGIAVDPNFATNGYVFLYYSLKKAATCDSTTVNRVARYVMTGDTLADETVLIDNIPSPAGNHNAGDLEFGKDDLLYISVGDGGCDYLATSQCAANNTAARRLSDLLGKVLRIDRDGNVPAGNPFASRAGSVDCRFAGRATAPSVCREIFATGLRNPFRIVFDPNAAATRFYINDVGQSTWEEIDDGVAGADYGWNVREGHCATGSTTNCGPPPAGMTNPILDYGRGDGCGTITGGAFVPNGVWSSAFGGKYVFADYLCGKIFRLDANSSGGFSRVDFVTGLGGSSATHLEFGPYGRTQALYYTTYATGGQVRRIVNTDTLPAVSIEGFSWYGDGPDAKTGPSTTTVSAFGTSLRPNTAYRLVSAPVQQNAALRCTVDALPVSPNTRTANARGFVPLTSGTINRPAGNYDICFVTLDGVAAGQPMRFTVT